MATPGAMACAQECIDSCSPYGTRSETGYYGIPYVVAGEPQVYADCLNNCQAGCPGGAPEPTNYGGEDFCLGPLGVVRCTVQDTAGALWTYGQDVAGKSLLVLAGLLLVAAMVAGLKMGQMLR